MKLPENLFSGYGNYVRLKILEARNLVSKTSFSFWRWWFNCTTMYYPVFQSLHLYRSEEVWTQEIPDQYYFFSITNMKTSLKFISVRTEENHSLVYLDLYNFYKKKKTLFGLYKCFHSSCRERLKTWHMRLFSPKHLFLIIFFLTLKSFCIAYLKFYMSKFICSLLSLLKEKK